jgi:hypothetical protein
MTRVGLVSGLTWIVAWILRIALTWIVAWILRIALTWIVAWILRIALTWIVVLTWILKASRTHITIVLGRWARLVVMHLSFELDN